MDSTATDYMPNAIMKELSLADCRQEAFFKNIDPLRKANWIKNNIHKCVNLVDAGISGGTDIGNTEHIVLIEWQHCSKFTADPEKNCATKEEFDSYLADVKVTL